MSESRRRVCVTGGAGFIGVRLVSALLARGSEVVVLDDLSVGRRERVPGGARLVVGDIRDPGAVRAALDGCDAVAHLAARVAIRSSFEFAVDDASINLVGTASVLRGAIAAGTVRRFVLASSMAVYADSAEPRPLDESHPTVPASPYGVSKLAAEQLVQLLCAQAGMSGGVLRLFNTYGPGQTFSPYVGVVTIFVHDLLAGRTATIFGDGEQCRDLVHVDDVAGAFALALEADRAEGTYNIGTGHATSVNAIYEQVRAALRVTGKVGRVAPVAGELRYSIADIGAARRALGYQPQHRIAAGMADIVAEIAAHAAAAHANQA